MMESKQLWPAVVMGSVIICAVTILLIKGVAVDQIIAAFAIVGNILTLMLWSKVQKIENNTNGTLSSTQEMVRDLVEHTKRTVPIDTVVKADEK